MCKIYTPIFKFDFHLFLKHIKKQRNFSTLKHKNFCILDFVYVG